MQQTENDNYLAQIGLLIGKTKILPTEQCFKDLVADPELLYFTLYWLQKVADDDIKNLLRSLGIYVKYEDISGTAISDVSEDEKDRSEYIFNIPWLLGLGSNTIDTGKFLRGVLKPKPQRRRRKDKNYFDFSRIQGHKFYEIIKKYKQDKQDKQEMNERNE